MHDLQLARETQSSFESWRSQGGAAGTPAGCDIAVSVRAASHCCTAIPLRHTCPTLRPLHPPYWGASWWPVLGTAVWARHA